MVVVLPRITGKEVEVVDTPGVVVVRICLNGLAPVDDGSVGVLADADVVGIRISLKRTGSDTVICIGCCYVQAGADVELEGFKTMDLIVQGQPADRPAERPQLMLS